MPWNRKKTSLAKLEIIGAVLQFNFRHFIFQTLIPLDLRACWRISKSIDQRKTVVCSLIFKSPSAALELWDGEGEASYAPSSYAGHIGRCAISPDGTRIVSYSQENGRLLVWDGESGGRLGQLGDFDIVWSTAFAPDSWRVVSASEDGTLKIWDVTNLSLLHTLTGHAGHVWGCAFSPDGARIVSTSSDETLKIWDTASGRVLNTFTGHVGRSCLFSPDGTRILYLAPRALSLCDAATGATLARFPAGAFDWSRAYAFFPRLGEYIVSGSGGTVKIWEIATGKELHAFVADGYLFSWSPEAKAWVIASSMGISVWRNHFEDLMCEYRTNAPVAAVNWGADGMGLSLFTIYGQLHRLRLENAPGA